MTNRDRIVQTLLCKPTDRAPFGIGIGFSPWKQTRARWEQESGLKDLDLRKYFGFDRDFALAPAEFGTFPHFPETVVSEDAECVITINYRGMKVRNTRGGGSMPEFLDNPVKNRSDWDRYKAERLQPLLAERMPRIAEFVAECRANDVPVQVGKFPWGCFGVPRDLLGTEELLVGFYTEPDLVRDIMETFTDLWLLVYEAVQKHIQIDHIHIWEDMSGKQGSLISMQMVEDFMMPCYDRIHAFARANSIPLISVDSDGLVDELVPAMMKHGINVFFPFEVQAGNDVIEYRKKYPGLGIIGGLDKNVLADDAPRGAMHRELDKAEKMLAMGGCVPGCDHLIPPNVSWKTWCEFVHALKKMMGV